MIGSILRFVHCFFLFAVRTLAYIFRWFQKRLLRYLSGQCELERITLDAGLDSHEKNIKISNSLRHSRSLSFILDQSVENVEWSVQQIYGNKYNVKEKALANGHIEDMDLRRRRFEDNLKLRLTDILGYERLKQLVEERRTEFYDSKNEQHEKLLLKLWSALFPNNPLSGRISAQWAQDVGFQGPDPATDFRGMGIVGLQQLVFMSERYPSRTRLMLEGSKNAETGYPFAIVGISMTALTRDLLISGRLKRYFTVVKMSNEPSDLVHFHQLYCKTFFLFDKFWHASKPSSIMDYLPLRTQFYDKLCRQLESPEDCVALVSLTLD